MLVRQGVLADTATAVAGEARSTIRPAKRQIKRSPNLVIASAFLLAVAAFVASTLVVATRLRQVSVQTAAISTDAMPEVMTLITLREQLDELVRNLGEAVDAGANRVPNFEHAVAAIGEQSTVYDEHASRLARQDTWLRTRAAVSATVKDSQRVQDLLVLGRMTDARSLLDSEVRPAASAADTMLWQLVSLHAAEGEQLAHHIDRARRQATLLLFGLDALCVGFAVSLTVFALRAVARYSRFLVARSQELEQFAGRVAHDLRGPLSPILFALQRLNRDFGAEDPRRSSIDRAVRSFACVTTLIDDLLAFAKSGARIDPSARASTLTAVRTTVDGAVERAGPRGVELRVDPCAEDIVVKCPPGVLASIVSNLVQNSIKYIGAAPERRVTVRTARVRGHAHVEVEDTGPGLPPGMEDRVFEPYVRGDRSGESGLGLGLATVKRLAEAYGGSVGVRSRADGCVFWFELPAED